MPLMKEYSPNIELPIFGIFKTIRALNTYIINIPIWNEYNYQYSAPHNAYRLGSWTFVLSFRFSYRTFIFTSYWHINPSRHSIYSRE